MIPILMVAGEASGDLHAARLLSELRYLRPDVEAFGMGGSELEAAGMERVADSAEISVVGITEVFKILSRAKELFAELLAEVERRQPTLAVLVDFPEFNLRLAKELKARGVPVVYYISPQVWAWRRRRVKSIARVVDKMLVLFPFEVDFYRKHNVDAVHVGHPLVDEVPQLPHVWDRPREPGAPLRIALLPGSRRSEVAALLPVMLDSALEISRRLPIEVELIRAPSLPRALFATAIEESGIIRPGFGTPGLEFKMTTGDRFARLSEAHLALCASGTATLELGLLGTPMVVVYRLNLWSYLLARLLVRLPHFSLVNLVLGRALGATVVPELIQSQVQPAEISGAVVRLLESPERIVRMRAELAQLRTVLGESGASGRAAAEIATMLPDR